MICKTSAHPDRLVQCTRRRYRASFTTAGVLMSNLVRYDTCRYIQAVDRELDIGFYGQKCTCYRPYYPTTRTWSTSPFMVLAQSLPDRSGTLYGQPPRVRSSHIRPLRLRSVTDREPQYHIVDLYLRTKFDGGLQSLHDAGDDTVYWKWRMLWPQHSQMKWNDSIAS